MAARTFPHSREAPGTPGPPGGLLRNAGDPRHLRTRRAHLKWRGRGAGQVTVAQICGPARAEREREREHGKRDVNLNLNYRAAKPSCGTMGCETSATGSG